MNVWVYTPHRHSSIVFAGRIRALRGGIRHMYERVRDDQAAFLIQIKQPISPVFSSALCVCIGFICFWSDESGGETVRVISSTACNKED